MCYTSTLGTFRSYIIVETCKQGSRGNANDYRCSAPVYRFYYCAIMDKDRLKCFVANRVIQITDLTSTFEWHHINSKDNPADSLSRGLFVDYLNGNDIWWCGPDFLHRDVDFLNNWDCSNTDPVHMNELKPIMNTFVQSTLIDFFDDI
ncbi:hypothetical protein TNCV_3997131 [Trichonephila clavipes]|nr:hypothetical protein TNCV_3997131 [Trichonephila clavipes]